jgi:formylglycine-generating enzyme required for sulfatase activity
MGSDYCPATWLSFSEANTVAEKLGGQLPTAEQMTAALRRAGTVKRLRSSAWSKQFPLIKQWVATTGTAQSASSPDIGSFSRETGLLGGNDAYRTDPSASDKAAPDEQLWLKSVLDQKMQPSSGFINLIGNAAEWVNDNGRPAVMGGSVVSSPKLPNDTPIPITTKDGSYFDVTFRLVVKLGPGGANAWRAKFEEAVAAIPQPPKPAGP